MVRSIFALAALLSVASATLVADLVTPMVLVGGSTRVNCRLINLSAAPVQTHVQLIAYGGSVPADGGQVTLPPGAMYGIFSIIQAISSTAASRT